MRLLAVLLSALMLCVSVLAQPSPINRRAMAIAGLAPAPFSPSQIPTLALWWVSSDLQTNVSINTWTDRVQGVSFYQGASARQPTNSLGNGVVFKSGWMLTNASAYVFNLTNDSMVILYKRYSDTPTFQDILCNTSESGAVLQTPSGTILYGWRNVGGANLYHPPLNVFQDVIGIPTAGPSFDTYSNNVFVVSIGLAVNAKFALSEMGNDNSFLNSDWFSGYVAEIQVYTNSALSAFYRSAIHKDLTNRWNYSP